uniref:Trehalase n=1 Tax=Ditylenchus dipsaci TaxID=166011 RepID=A0A915D361_9BILA
MPLFTECYNDFDQAKSERLYEHMKDIGVFHFPGGVPTSMVKDSGEQWDFPNGWSPLNHIIIEGLRKSTNPKMQEEGYRLAEKWVFGNYRVYRNTHSMWEKYNVVGESKNPGSGGEYEVQDGFGWSNGVILDLLVSYYDRMDWIVLKPNDSWIIKTNICLYIVLVVWKMSLVCFIIVS